MRASLMSLLFRDDGQDLAEYGIAVAVISAGIVLAAAAIAGDVNNLWSKAKTVLDSVSN